jgi:dipeptidyl aminopeptidase/acylaminoacyl peptidase
VVTLALLVVPASAHAAFPGQNGKIAFSFNRAIWTMNPDGSNRTQLTTPTGSEVDGFPAWSPDGSKIAFRHYRCNPGCGIDLHIMDANGAGDHLLIGDGNMPSWSPSGTQLLFTRDVNGCSEVWRVNADGTGAAVQIDPINFCDADVCCVAAPSWSPDGQSIALSWQNWELIPDPNCVPSEPDFCEFDFGPPLFRARGASGRGSAPNWSPDGAQVVTHTTDWSHFSSGAIAVSNTDGSGSPHEVTPGLGDADPAWSPDGTKIAFGRSGSLYTVNAADGSGETALGGGSSPDWQPLPVDTPPTYVKPKGATPLRVPLVPAYRACTEPNRTHGAPLADPSCAPPRREPMGLTIGVGDETPPPAKSIGSVVIKVQVGAPGPPDDADAQLLFSLTNVLNDGSNTDYTGQLATKLSVRLTDAHGGVGATTQDFPFVFQVPCTATADTTLGSTCQTATTAEAVMPGVITEGDRAIWALDRIRVYVPYGSALTNPDRLFAVQGIFIP